MRNYSIFIIFTNNYLLFVVKRFKFAHKLLLLLFVFPFPFFSLRFVR